MNAAGSILRVACPAKINWFLNVGALRPDGYHHLCTVMQMISLADELLIQPAHDGSITVEAAGAGCACTAEENLVTRAARLLHERYRPRDGARITLTKRVPVAAGLGGGSSDAAAALRALARLWELEIAHETMGELALALGADVPFFLGTPAATCCGIGERLTPLAPREYWLVLWNPGWPLSTRAVYHAFDAARRPQRDPARFAAAYAGGSVAAVAEAIWNNLAYAAEECQPALTEMMAATRRLGARAAWVSGSGPTVVSLCDDEGHARALAGALSASAAPDAFVHVCHTLTEVPE